MSAHLKSASAAAAHYDVAIIGAGHNGLICAALLAKAGRKVVVLEAEAQVGGLASTGEFAPGFKVSSGAHLLHLMPASVYRELALARHGLALAASQLPTVALGDAGSVILQAGPAGVHTEGLSASEAAAYESFLARCAPLAAALQAIFERAPPRLGSGALGERLELLRLGWRLRRLGRPALRELLRIGAMNIYDLLHEHFTDPTLMGALAFDAVLGSNYGPRSPGSVLTYLCRLAAQGAASGGLQLPRGGMGALAAALHRAAASQGVEVRTDAEVARILVDDDRACGVRLRSGEAIAAAIVVSSADPKTTLLGLLGPEHLDTGFVRRVHHLRTRGLTGKLHLALKSAPRFAGLNAGQHTGRILLAPSMDYLERAFNSTKYGEFAAAPALEITVPSLNDPDLAPPGSHVLSAIVQYLPHTPQGGEGAGQRCLDTLLAALERRAPGLSAALIGAELLTPLDIERRFRVSGGHWHQAELALDQFYMVRPVPGAAQYATPLAALYLCGAGSHPGGGLMGYAGRNAARRILAAREAA